VRVWDLATGRPVGDPFTGHPGGVNAVATAQLDGRPVAVSAGDDETVRVWDLATGRPVGDPCTGHTGVVTAVAVAQLDGRPVAVSAGWDRTVRVWDLATGRPVGDPCTGHTGGVNAVAVAQLSGQSSVVSAGGDGTLQIKILHGSDDEQLVDLGTSLLGLAIEGATYVVATEQGLVALHVRETQGLSPGMLDVSRPPARPASA